MTRTLIAPTATVRIAVLVNRDSVEMVLSAQVYMLSLDNYGMDLLVVVRALG